MSENLVVYKKMRKHKGKNIVEDTIIGIEKDGHIHQWMEPGKFSKKSEKLPAKTKLKKQHLTTNDRNYLCGKSVNKLKHNGLTPHYIWFAGIWNITYVVYIGKENNKNVAYIYKMPNHNKKIEGVIGTQIIKLNLDHNYNKWKKMIKTLYTEFVGKYEFNNIFTSNNVILLQLVKNKDKRKDKYNKYVLVWNDVIEFMTEDIIEHLYTPIAGSYSVPYAIGLITKSKYLYFMDSYPIVKIPMKYFSFMKTKPKSEWNDDLYSYIYGHKGNESLLNYSKKVPQKIISHS